MRNLDTNMNMYKKKSRLPIISYMVVLFIFTLVFTSASLSHYAFLGNFGDTTPSQAGKFNVSITHDPWVYTNEDGIEYENTLMAETVGGSVSSIFTLTNNGEVSIRARLEIDSQLILENDIQSVTYNPSSWFNIPIGESRDVTITIVGAFKGNNVQMHFDYEQID